MAKTPKAAKAAAANTEAPKGGNGPEERTSATPASPGATDNPGGTASGTNSTEDAPKGASGVQPAPPHTRLAPVRPGMTVLHDGVEYGAGQSVPVTEAQFGALQAAQAVAGEWDELPAADIATV